MAPVTSVFSSKNLAEKNFLRMIRKVAYLGDKEIADLMDNQFQKNPQLMQYKLRENYCVDCNKYRAREECRELSCRARNGRCIPLDNTLGLFAFDCLRYDEVVNHANKSQLKCSNI